jgi:cysteinyl-tRNA synthetase
MEEYSPDVFRFFVLSTHYRSPIDFSQEILEQSQNSLKRIYKLSEIIEELLESEIPETGENDLNSKELLHKTRENFTEAMDNDFNTPFALSILFDFIREINKSISKQEISKNSLNDVKIFLKEIGEILGFNFTPKKTQDDLTEELVDILTRVRQKLRQKKEWELSDEIRSKLGDLDIVLEDK